MNRLRHRTPVALLVALSLAALSGDARARGASTAPQSPPYLAGAYGIEEAALRDDVRLAFAYVNLSAPQSGRQRNEYAYLFHLSGRLSLLERLEIGVLLPLMSTKSMPQGGGMAGPDIDDVHGFGNVTLQLKVALKRWEHLGVAAYLHGVLPTFQRYEDSDYSEDELLTFGAVRSGLALSGRLGPLSGHLEVGMLCEFLLWDESKAPFAAYTPNPRLLTRLLLAGSAAYRVLPSLSLVTAVQLRTRLTDSYDNFGRWHEDRTYVGLSGALRIHRRRLTIDLGARWAPMSHRSAREDFALSLAFSFAFGKRALRGS